MSDAAFQELRDPPLAMFAPPRSVMIATGLPLLEYRKEGVIPVCQPSTMIISTGWICINEHIALAKVSDTTNSSLELHVGLSDILLRVYVFGIH